MGLFYFIIVTAKNISNSYYNEIENQKYSTHFKREIYEKYSYKIRGSVRLYDKRLKTKSDVKDMGNEIKFP